MGSMYTEDMKERMTERARLLTHLQHSHFPPVSLDFIPAAEKAIEAFQHDEFETEITMCNGKTLTAEAIVCGLHLDSFV